MSSGLNSSDTWASKWCRIFDAKTAGDGLRPKTSQVNLVIVLFLSLLVFSSCSLSSKVPVVWDCQTFLASALYNLSYSYYSSWWARGCGRTPWLVFLGFQEDARYFDWFSKTTEETQVAVMMLFRWLPIHVVSYWGRNSLFFAFRQWFQHTLNKIFCSTSSNNC